MSTIVLVHRRQLLDQWLERLAAFLGVPAKSIGRIGGGRSRPTGLLDVAIIQSLVRKGVVDDRVAEYGHVIIDECHHPRAQAAARPFEHFVLVQPTAFQPKRSPDSDKRAECPALYQELIDDELRTRRICDDVIEAARVGRSPLVLTERNDHLDALRLKPLSGPSGNDWAHESHHNRTACRACSASRRL